MTRDLKIQQIHNFSSYYWLKIIISNLYYIKKFGRIFGGFLFPQVKKQKIGFPNRDWRNQEISGFAICGLIRNKFCGFEICGLANLKSLLYYES